MSAGHGAPAVGSAQQASIVQFPHPVNEHVPRGNVMPWNTGPKHARKFMRSRGTTVDPGGQPQITDDLVFWGEWEPPSVIERRWSPAKELPTVIHLPSWSDPPPGWRQNTDPWVFGPKFLYSNCKQLTPKLNPSALQRLSRGSLILFGSAKPNQGRFILDTAFVVDERISQFQTGDRLDAVSEAFQVCTVDSLATDPNPVVHHAQLTLFTGATPSQPVFGMFSFVPCRRWDGDSSRFPRPSIELPDIINPKSKQSPSGAKQLRPIAEVRQAWESVVDQVLDAGLELGTQIAEPARQY